MIDPHHEIVESGVTALTSCQVYPIACTYREAHKGLGMYVLSRLCSCLVPPSSVGESGPMSG
jgi:hypothetical protein